MSDEVRGAGRSRVLLFALLAATALLVVGGGLLRATAPEPERVSAAGAAAAAVPVRTLRVEPRVVRARVAIAAMVEPRRSVEIFSETHGRVVEIGAEELDRVEAGQVLVRIDPLRAAIALERARAAVERGESELALAEANLARRRTLRDSDVASVSALEDAENHARVARASLREARATLEEARDELEQKVIRAPFAGFLRRFPVEVGEFVRDGEVVAEVLDLAAARLEVGVSDREVVAIAPDTPARVALDAYPGRSFEGRVLRVGAAADPATKKFPVEVEVPNREGALLPGMVARVELELAAGEPRQVVPREAVVEEFGLRFVFVVSREADETFAARRTRVEVRDLPFHPGDVEVVSGLEPGAEIVVTGVSLLRDGAPVRPRPAAGDGLARREGAPAS